MSGSKILLAAIGGAAIAAVLVNYLGTEKGKEMLESASGVLKDLTGKATDFAKNNMSGVKNIKEGQPS